MNVILIRLQDRLVNYCEINKDQVDLKINLGIKSKRQTHTRHQLLIQAWDLNRNLCMAECSSNEFTLVSHSRYLNLDIQQQRLKLQRHLEDQNNDILERQTHPNGFALSYVGLQQVSGRILTGQYVRFPSLSFGGTLQGCSNVVLRLWLVQLSSNQSVCQVSPEFGQICSDDNSMDCENLNETQFLSGCETNEIEISYETGSDLQPQLEEDQFFDPEYEELLRSLFPELFSLPISSDGQK